MTLGLSQGCSTRTNVGVRSRSGQPRVSIAMEQVNSPNGPKWAVHLRDRVGTIKIEPRSTTARAKGETYLNTQGHQQAYLEEAMGHFQQERRERAYQAIYPYQRIKTSNVQEAYTLDVEMKSVRSHRSRSDFLDPEDVDPDDSGQEERRRAMVATAEKLQNDGEIPQLIRVSAMTELKEFSGKDRDGNKARARISKVKSAFLRDQAPDEGNQAHQDRDRRRKIGYLVHTSRTRGALVSTLEDRDLAQQLTLQRCMDVDEVEETLRACQRMENRQINASMGLNKFHQQTTTSSMSSKTTRALRAIRERVESSRLESESIESDEDMDCRRVCVTATPDQEK
uniref:Uncharacterized protein n=1 Tax=Hyaloperonospora arabidopsidis (strain Emoy2) TaxID=559515 RepID=M4BNQ2_HYAAE